MPLRLQMKALVYSNVANLKHESRSDISNLALLNLKISSSNPALIEETAQELQRWFIGEYIEKLLSSVKRNEHLNALIRGFVWHFLATDAKRFLMENKQEINGEWLSNEICPLINNNRDPMLIKRELSRLVRGDPSVIRKL